MTLRVGLDQELQVYILGVAGPCGFIIVCGDNSKHSAGGDSRGGAEVFNTKKPGDGLMIFYYVF